MDLNFFPVDQDEKKNGRILRHVVGGKKARQETWTGMQIDRSTLMKNDRERCSVKRVLKFYNSYDFPQNVHS